jgi:hypothetical protein
MGGLCSSLHPAHFTAPRENLVIASASEAIQNNLITRLDCFLSDAPRNDGGAGGAAIREDYEHQRTHNEQQSYVMRELSVIELDQVAGDGTNPLETSAARRHLSNVTMRWPR